MSSWADKFKEGFNKRKSEVKRRDEKEQEAYSEYKKYAKSDDSPRKKAKRRALRDIFGKR